VEGVEWKSLGELSLKITDGAHSSPKSTIEGYYMPSVKDMTDNGFDFSDCKIISKEDYEDLKRIGCQPNLNDILIAKDGPMLKYVFVVKEKLDIVVLSSIAIITPKIELVMPEYLVCYLKQSSFREIVIRDYSSKGGVPRIILKNFRKIVIPIPSRETQQEIVEKLDAFENLIQSLEQEIKLRKQQYEYYREKLLTFEKE
jgi:type I restriction enzyme S subunit